MKRGDIVLASDYDGDMEAIGVYVEFVELDAKGRYLCKSLCRGKHGNKKPIPWRYCVPRAEANGPLHLTLKKKWFDMIASGVKKEEYREMKPYWHKRLMGKKKYDRILFRNGYSKTAPKLLVELIAITSSLGIVEWGAPENQEVYILVLGAILDVRQEAQ